MHFPANIEGSSLKTSMHLYCDFASLCKFGALKSYLFLVLSRVPLSSYLNFLYFHINFNSEKDNNLLPKYMVLSRFHSLIITCFLRHLVSTNKHKPAEVTQSSRQTNCLKTQASKRLAGPLKFLNYQLYYEGNNPNFAYRATGLKSFPRRLVTCTDINNTNKLQQCFY